MPVKAPENHSPEGLLPCLRLFLPRKRLAAFFPLLQKGCFVQCPKPLSVEDFLLSLPGFPGAQVLEFVQTVFLDGHPVDDIQTAVLGPDCEMALSAAMPGALGAIMRRGGYYASMRRDITFRGQGRGPVSGAFFITVKLFNLLISRLGPSLLERGIVLEAGEIANLIGDFQADVARVEWKGQPVAPEEFAPLLRSLPSRLQVQVLLLAKPGFNL